MPKICRFWSLAFGNGTLNYDKNVKNFFAFFTKRAENPATVETVAGFFLLLRKGFKEKINFGIHFALLFCETITLTQKESKMKLIIAYIKPERVNAVKQELYSRNIFKMSITNALGCGQQKGYVEAYRGALQEVNLLKKVRFAIGVNDDFVEATVDAIIAGARTGNIGDGKIFVLPMVDCIRIRTGEHGVEAIG